MPESSPRPTPDNRTRPPADLTVSVADPNLTTDAQSTTAPADVVWQPSQRYTLLEEIARGGMGVIWRATDTVLGREVAVKVLQDKYTPDSGVARRFADEARITAQLQHPAIPPVHDCGSLPDGRPFLAMKLIRGRTLDELLRQRSHPADERGRFLAIFEQLCQAVAYAHAHRVIHRDLKPANVMVGGFGEVQVMDWGLAKVLSETALPAPTEAKTAQTVTAILAHGSDTGGSEASYTQAGSILGTLAYMPPEQAAGELAKIDQRSDVFGLGAILTVILTGTPPYDGASVEALRVSAIRGDLTACRARLDACGAEPELVALCKRCLAFAPAERPRDAGAVAEEIARLRAAAEERARRAELERVQAEAEKTAAEERALERRRRRRLWLGAAAALMVAAVMGLMAVLVVQRRANADLAFKNQELADEQAKVQARFELAQKAIATFHTGVSEDVLLQNDQFRDLKTKLLKQAAGFYGDMEKLLEGQTDEKSRRLLAEGYYQLGELTEKIGSKVEALALHRKALSMRRELAGTSGGNVELQLDVARSLRMVGRLLNATGDLEQARSAFQEQQDIAEALEVRSPQGDVRAILAHSHHDMGVQLYDTGKQAEALVSFQKALAIREKLADANPTVIEYQHDLARTYNFIGILMRQTARQEEALAAYENARKIGQRLADANPDVIAFESDLALSYSKIGGVLSEMGKPNDARTAYETGRAIRQKLAKANPAVMDYQRDLANSYNDIGTLLSDSTLGKQEESLAAFQKARDIQEKLAESNPSVTKFQSDLAGSYHNIAMRLAALGKPEEGLADYEKSLVIFQKLAAANPTITEFQGNMANVYNERGRLQAKLGRFDEALTSFDRGEAICARLMKANPRVTFFKAVLGESHGFRGWTLWRSGRPAQAAAELRQAVALLDGIEERDTEILFDRAWELALLAGLPADSKSGLTSQERADFADKAVAALRAAIDAGWANLERLKEPDFDSLRKRDDFRKLVEDLEKKVGRRAS